MKRRTLFGKIAAVAAAVAVAPAAVKAASSESPHFYGGGETTEATFVKAETVGLVFDGGGFVSDRDLYGVWIGSPRAFGELKVTSNRMLQT